MGHSCQAVSLLAGSCERLFAVALAARIHEGMVFLRLARQESERSLAEIADWHNDRLYAGAMEISGPLPRRWPRPDRQ